MNYELCSGTPNDTLASNDTLVSNDMLSSNDILASNDTGTGNSSEAAEGNVLQNMEYFPSVYSPGVSPCNHQHCGLMDIGGRVRDDFGKSALVGMVSLDANTTTKGGSHRPKKVEKF